ncbi:MAG TPA: S-layer homology domain-containing protein, partial [Vicinamibacterales bacterium]|nr:S-layer homology domain-containing protein [Vicinamibacterales bacterium]
EAARARAALARLPAEYREIEKKEVVTRGELAALAGVRLADLLAGAPRRAGVVVTDVRGHWAAPWILPVVGAGLMDPYPNHTFQPDAPVNRGDLARLASRALALVSRVDPKRYARWRAERPHFSDLPEHHVAYPAAAIAVAAGIVPPLEGGAFHLTRPVSGAEAAAAVDRLRELASKRR